MTWRSLIWSGKILNRIGRQVAGWITVQGISQYRDLGIERLLMFQAGMRIREILLSEEACSELPFVDADEQIEFATCESA